MKKRFSITARRIHFTVRLICAMLFCAIFAFAQQTLDGNAKNPDELYDYAAGLYNRKFYDMALTELDKFIGLYPEDARLQEATVMKIYCLKLLERDEEMIEQAKKFRQKYPQSKHTEEISKHSADLLFQKKKYEEASEIYKELTASKKEENAEFATYYLAQCFINMNRKSEALELLKALADKPFDAKLACRIYAASEYVSALYESQNTEQAVIYLRKILSVQDIPNEIREKALFQYIVIAYKAGNTQEAMRYCEAYIAKFPNGKNAREIRKYRIYLNASDSNNAAKTMELAKEWRTLYPDYVDYTVDYQLAVALLNCKLFDESIPYFNRVENDTAASTETRKMSTYCATYALLMAGHFAEAQQKAELYLETYPKSANAGDVHSFKGHALLAQDMQAEAIEAFKKAMAFFDGNTEYWKNEALKLLAIYQKNNMNTEAINLLLRMSNKFKAPDKWTVLIEAAVLMQKEGRTDEAIENYGKVAANTDSPDLAYSALGGLLNIYFEKKDFEAALAAAQTYGGNCPESIQADLNYTVATIYYQLDDSKNATDTLASTLKQEGISEEKQLRANILLSTIYIGEEKYMDAQPVLDKIFEINLETLFENLTPAFVNGAGDAYYNCHNQDKAEKLFNMIELMPNATQSDKLLAKLNKARIIMPSKPRLQEASDIFDEIARNIEQNDKMPILFRKGELFSLQAEAQMRLGKSSQARIIAEKALNSDSDSHSKARALYVLAKIRLEDEKQPTAANSLATQCFILIDDAEYSPLAMEVSIKSFNMLKQKSRAKQVFNELNSKYPSWLAEHPEVKKLIAD